MFTNNLKVLRNKIYDIHENFFKFKISYFDLLSKFSTKKYVIFHK